MASLFFFTLSTFIWMIMTVCRATSSFQDNYQVKWGADHVYPNHDGTTVDLSLDQRSGGGFESKLDYSSGIFHMDIKLPILDDYGVLSTFYLMEKLPFEIHDELDFEFIGSDTLPLILSTNVFTHGIGGREQKFNFWFDPRADYHSYSILWNAHQVVFYVDNIPIRVFKNLTNIGIRYPIGSMKVTATNWYADWALGGHHTNWTRGPFNTTYKSFNIEACSNSDIVRCSSSSDQFWWNREQYWQLNSTEEIAYQHVRKTYLVYDYCTDKPRYPVPPPECMYV